MMVLPVLRGRRQKIVPLGEHFSDCDSCEGEKDSSSDADDADDIDIENVSLATSCDFMV
jgi:hypothetical protein